MCIKIYFLDVRSLGIRLVRGTTAGGRLDWEVGGAGAGVVAAEEPDDFRTLPPITRAVIRFSVVPSKAVLSIELRLRVIMLVRKISSTVSLRVRCLSGVDS